MDIKTQYDGLKFAQDIRRQGAFAGRLGEEVFNYAGDRTSAEFLGMYEVALRAIADLANSIVSIQSLLPTLADCSKPQSLVPISSYEQEVPSQ